MEQRRVLIIENDPVFEAEIRQRLEQLQFAVTSALDGPAGIESAKGAPPSIIILAAELPGMSGYSVCNRLKKTQTCSSVR